MSETNNPQPEKKGFLQRVLDKFKSTSKEVSEKVEDTISDVKNSEFVEKVSEVAENVGEKVSEMAKDVSEKISEVAKDVSEKAQDIVNGKED